MDIEAGCFRSICLATHTQMFLYQAGVQRNWVVFYFLGSAWKIKHRIILLSKYTWGGGCCCPFDLAIKGGKWRKIYVIWPPFRNPSETKSSFPLFLLTITSQSGYSLYSSGTRANLALICLVSFQNFCVILDVLIQNLKT